MTISQCNDLWDLVNNNSITYQVQNNTIIENHTSDIEDIKEELEDYIDELFEDYEIDSSFDFDKYKM